ncbi:flagellar assembly protein FliO [Pseudomonas oryzihabitans]|nr:flagellar assembly protein FliO [Pseudomonas psychrotolerans]KTT62925.1 flagellar assembly protein FliO [Pseudomonas psychrotolerans]
MKSLLLPLSVLPLTANAAEATSPGLDVGTQLGQLVLGLLLVIGLILGLAWLVRRVQQQGPRGQQAIKVISTQHLGPRERLVLIQVGQEQLLIGVAGGRITPLHNLREPVRLGDAEAATPEFAQRLLELISRDPKAKP